MTAIRAKQAKYLTAGAWNTFFGYFFSIFLYEQTKYYFSIIIIGVVANIVAITMSFLTYKIFVFQKKGNWISEYLKCYVVYGVGGAIGIVILYIGVQLLGFQFWLVQACSVILVTLLSYISHSKFTFKSH